MTAQDKNYVMPLVEQFYHSEAVAHTVPMDILEETFRQAVSQSSCIEGFILLENGTAVGYAYITHLYASEAGACVMLEELLVEPKYRGKGIGTAFFHWLFAAFPNTARFRLEVTPGNQKAKALYESLGFEILAYDQMVRGR